MGKKLKSKTHLLDFLIFWAVFGAFGFKVWKKYWYGRKKIFFWKNRKRCQKTQNFTLISNPLKKLWKNAQKKVISKSLTNMSESEKSAFFRHVFANNFFFGTFFQNFFNGFKISVKFCVFWHLFRFLKFFFFLRSYQYFFRTLTAYAQETAQKNGKSFFMNVS